MNSMAPGRRPTATSSRSWIRRSLQPGPREANIDRYLQAEPLHRKRRSRDSRRSRAGGARRRRRSRPRGAADALRQRAARQEADNQPAVRARGAAHESRRLQRAHRALRGDGAIDRHAVADRRRPGVHARRVLLPRVARGVHRQKDRVEGLWLPVDPTLNQFPADATHLRLARGGLDKQAVVLPLIGRLKMTVLDVELAPGANRRWSGRRT